MVQVLHPLRSRSLRMTLLEIATSVTDPLGRVTSYTFDNEGRVLSQTLPDPDGAVGLTSPVSSYTYDSLGRVLTVTDPRSGCDDQHIRRTWSTAHHHLSGPDGAGGQSAPVETYTYNAVGLIQKTDAMGHDTDFSLDGRGRVSSMTDPLGNITEYVYGPTGQITSQTDPDPDGAGSLESPVTNWAYDVIGRLISKTDAESGTTNYGYDSASNLISLTDPVGNTTSFAYDAQNQLVIETNELNKSRSFYYDVAEILHGKWTATAV